MANELRKILNYSANDIDKLLQNGVYSVETEEERDALPLSIKTINRTVYIKNSGKMYVWTGNAWESLVEKNYATQDWVLELINSLNATEVEY